MAMPSVQIYWRWYSDIAIICHCSTFNVCSMWYNSLKILGNVYALGSTSWGVIEEDLSGASSARVRFSVGIAAAHVRFCEASYVRRSDVFFVQNGEPWKTIWPGSLVSLATVRNAVARSLLPVVWSRWVPSLQTSARALWSLPLSLSDHDKLTYGIAIESQKEGKYMKISFWLDVLCHFQRHQCCF